MRNKKNRAIAFLMAASLWTNMIAAPIQAEEAADVAVTNETQEDLVEEYAEEETVAENAEIVETSQPETEEATEEIIEPAEEVPEPTENVPEPTEEITEPVEETESTEPAQTETEAPIDEGTEASEDTENASTEEMTEEATEDVATEAPAEEPGDPAETTESTEETTQTEETTEATTESETDTEEPETASETDAFEQAVQPYLSMGIADDRSMPLEWWYVVTGKVSEKDISEKNGELVFPDAVSVHSAEEMILLSYVRPEAYENRTITLALNGEAEVDLTGTVTWTVSESEQASLTYQGLGSQEHPFRGTVVYNDKSEHSAFVLQAPLFIGLSCKTSFLNRQGEQNTVTLVSKAKDTFDGLFAQHVYGENGVTAQWSILLDDPKNTDGTVYHLPPLFGTLHSGANIRLTLTDHTAQEPSDRGYLCAAMQDGAVLEVENEIREVTVPLVGELSEGAALMVPNQQNTMSEEEFQELVEYYRTMEVVPGEMPLEWWFVVSDRLDELKEYLEWKAEKEEGTVAVFAEDESESDSSGVETYEIKEIHAAEELINLSNTEASTYQELVITITASNSAYDLTQKSGTLTFQGLGSNNYPFKGTFQYSDGSNNTFLKVNQSFFNALSTDATVKNVNLECATTADAKSLLAENIIAGTNKESFAIEVRLRGGADQDNDFVLPALVDSIESKATVSLTATLAGTELPQIDARGFFCNTMRESAELTVNYPDNMPEFSTSQDNVGGLVGTMNASASLTVNDSKKDIVIHVATKGKSAGGLVGEMEDGASLSINASNLTVKQVTASTENGSYIGSLAATAVNPTFNFNSLTKISADTSSGDTNPHLTGYFVGGLVGKMECTRENENVSLNVLPVSGLKMKGNDCGGLFAELDNSCSTLTIPSHNQTADSQKLVENVTFTCTASNSTTQSAGGLIGWYNPQKEHCKLIAKMVSAKVSSTGFAYMGGLVGSATGTNAVTRHHDMELTDSNVEISSSTNDKYLGGIIGSVREKTAYVKVSGTVANNNHSGSQVFGGLIAYADDNGDLIEVGKAELSSSKITEATNSAGGLVGKMDSGVLYMTAAPTLDKEMLTKIPETRGWILGNRGNVLVCTTAEEWLTREDDKDTNDTGVWGQVLQLSKFDQTLVTIDETNHTCIIGALPGSDRNSYAVSGLSDFAAIALHMQLNAKGLLKFADEDIDPDAEVNLKLNSNIDLSGTGLTGLTRDKATTYAAGTTTTTERHSISITADENKTITLPSTVVYTVGNSGKSHSHQGLIAEVQDLTLTNLTIAGEPQVKSLDDEARCGIVNDIYGDATLTNVTSSVQWTDNATNNSSTISGMLTRLGNDNNKAGIIKIENGTWNGSIEVNCNVADGRSAAGFIGYGYAKEVDVKNCTISGKITKSTNDIANVGGLAAVLNQVDTLNITGLTVSNTIKAVNAVNVTGGLLGYQWQSDATTFSGVTIKGAELQAPKARFGGLVYSGSGYWKVEKNGITFTASEGTSNTFNGTSNGSRISGLILAEGFLNKKGLYLEVLYEGYKIEGNAVSGTSDFKYFDELVGKSINKTSDGNYSGIVSIATSDSANADDRKIDQNGCNTYKDKTKTDPYRSPETRYYYNLDLFRENSTQTGNIDTPEKMVLWSAYNSCASNLQTYFKRWATRTITGILDLTGYSFYPVPFDGTSISDAIITFGFQQLEEKEAAANNKKPSDKDRQHAEMHTGIFTSVVNDSSNTANMTFTVKELTLAGTVGGFNNTYGAIVRGNVQGKDAEHITTLAISGVKLNGIRVYGVNEETLSDSVAPLLIHGIDSYTTMNLSDVKTGNDLYQNGGETIKAATSLIGNVGGAAAAEIKLDFSDIRLEETEKKNGICSIFTHALFLESFQYQSGTCQGTYNFKSTDEYTLGREIQNTDSGRNKKQQYWFFGEDGDEIYKKLGLSGDASTAFNAYPRYVYVVEDNSTSHELDINLPAVDLLEGCGTYSHPYIITSAGQLKALNSALTGSPRAGWKVTITQAVLINGSFAKQDGHTQAGATDIVYQYNSGTWSTESGNTGNESIREYLRNAYYKITKDITLTEWSGLGGSTEASRFRGVIVGDESKPTITIDVSSGTQFGGLIAFSSGSVVKDLTITYTKAINVGLVNNTAPGRDIATSASFFGGVVGWCIGGDTIIDNVSVDYTSATTITADSPYTAVGGYVGLVGGASDQGGGGVVFRGTVRSTLNQDNSAQYYKNPYVGRVLDGYAVSESAEIYNGTDNYPIPHLTNAPNLRIEQGGIVNIGNAEGLWLFSAMENSRHGNAYSNGKSRSGDYSKIGQKVQESELIDEKANYSETDFYLWKHFGVTQEMPDEALTLNINADCDMSNFGNAFRGIGVSQGNLKVALTEIGYGLGEFLQIKSVNGNKHTITLAQNRKEQSGESLYWTSMGTGLFPILRCAIDTEIKELTLAGSTKLSAGYDFVDGDKLFETQPIRIGAGMMAGAVLNSDEKGSVKMTSVSVDEGNVKANVPFVGVLIGYCGATTLTGQKQLSVVSMKGCDVKNSKAQGITNIGGLIGYTYAKSVIVQNFEEIGIEISTDNQYVNIKNNSNATLNYSNGIGGMFGLVYNGELQVSDVKINGVTIKNEKQTTIGTDIGFGGLVGSINVSDNSKGYMENISLTGTISIMDEQAHVSTGGLIGYLSDMNINGWDTTDKRESSFRISKVEIGNENNSKVSLKGYQVGGLIGMVKDGQVTMTIGNETTDENGKKIINAVKIGNSKNDNGNVEILKSNYNGREFCLSGVIGITCNNPVIDIRNLELNGISVEKTNFTALILAKNMKAVTTLKIQNMQASNCNVGANAIGQSGFLYGKSDGSGNKLNVAGYNLMLNSCKIDTTAGALFGGDGNGSTIQLVAVSATDCTGTQKDFYNASDDFYIIRANYTGNQENTVGSEDPYVPVNPFGSGALKDKVGAQTITGDGAAFKKGATAETAIAEQIANATNRNDTNTAASQIYYNVSEAAKFYVTNATSNADPRISTYRKAGDNNADESATVTQPEDFPVLLLPAVSKKEVNEAVYKYISLLTNYDANETKMESQGKITATTYKWNGSKFEPVPENEKNSLTVAKNDTISVTTGCYDNTKNQFTLLDVSFSDPTGSGNSYHLYIPVVVQKLLYYRFSASASVGTNYYTSHYADLSTQVLASHGEQVTTLLSFEYERKKAEWQTAINNGENLLWDFDKVIRLATDSDDNLPQGTRLTLVDRSNQNKAYFAEYNGKDTTLKFLEFAGYKENHSYLCDGLPLTAEETTEAASDGVVQYVTADQSSATLRIGSVYYRPATDSDAGKKYNIKIQDTAAEDNFFLKEQYYLTIQTPDKSEAFVNIRIECESSLKNSQTTDMLPNKRMPYKDNTYPYTRNGAENRIVIGNFFNEAVTVTTESTEQISEEQNTIALTVQSTIRFVDEKWEIRYKNYAQGTKLWQRFDLQLKQWIPADTPTATDFAAGTVMHVEYEKNGKVVKNAGTQSLPETAVVGLEFPEGIDFTADDSGSNGVTLTAKVTLTYDAGTILSQFIDRSSDTAREGLQFLAFSHLAYSREALERSSVSASGAEPTRRFYRTNPKTASLLYTYDGKDDHARIDQLGVNGLMPEENEISSYASYDVSRLGTAAASATELRYAFRLLKKGEDGAYTEVNSSDKVCKIGDVTVRWLNSGKNAESVQGQKNVVNLAEGLDPSVPIEFNIPLTITTGAALEKAAESYDNYQVELTVSLYNGGTLINGSTASDYIIYTNAKIVTTLIETEPSAN